MKSKRGQETSLAQKFIFHNLFYNYDKRKEIEEFAKTHKDFEKYRQEMYEISLEPESENLNLQELYDKAKERTGTAEAGKK